MADEKNPFDQLSALVAAQVSPEKLQEHAIAILTKALDSYEVRNAVEKLVTPLVIEKCKEVIHQEEFKTLLTGATMKQLSSAVDICNAQLCASMVKFLNNLTATK